MNKYFILVFLNDEGGNTQHKNYLVYDRITIDGIKRFACLSVSIRADSSFFNNPIQARIYYKRWKEKYGRFYNIYSMKVVKITEELEMLKALKKMK